MNIQDARIVISGGTRGIGRALALELRERGGRVLVTGTRPSGCRRVHEETGLEATVCDVTEEEDVRALVAEVETRIGGVDVLIHSAGIQRELDLVRGFDMADAEQEIAVNLTGPIRLTRALLPALFASPRAAIVNVTSILALTPKRRAPVYCASKAGLASWTVALREQLRPRGVLVMELVPPLVATDMAGSRTAGTITPEQMAMAAAVGLQRDREVVRVGKARLAHALHRVAPGMLARKLRDS